MENQQETRERVVAERSSSGSAACLGPTRSSMNVRRPWSEQEEKILLDFAGEYSASAIARKIRRTEVAVRLRLFRRGESAKVTDGYTQRELARDLRVSPKTVRRWITLGWLKVRDRRITEKSLEEFFRANGSEIDYSWLDKEMRNWLKESFSPVMEQVRSPYWEAVRKHALKARICSRCGREVRGNAYYRHTKACARKAKLAADVGSTSQRLLG